MMFAVFHENKILHIGSDLRKADEFSKNEEGAIIVNAETIEDLQILFEDHVNCSAQSCEEEEVVVEINISEAFETVLNKLEEMGINPEDYAEKVAETGKKVVSNVRHLGHKMMKTAGENFIWLGDLLKEEAKDLKSEEDEA